MVDFWVRADSEEPAFRGDELRSLKQTQLHLLRENRILQAGMRLAEVECDACGNPHIERVDHVPAEFGVEERAYIRCPDGGRVRVEKERMDVWAIDIRQLASHVANRLGFAGTPIELERDRLWLLGSALFGYRTRDVFLVRGARWPNGVALAGNSRLVASPCPVILFPGRLPEDPLWLGKDRVAFSVSEFQWFGADSNDALRGIQAVVSEHDRGLTALDRCAFHKEGKIWEGVFAGKVVRIADSLGMAYIQELLRHPQVPIAAAVLASGSAGVAILQSPGIPMVDDSAISLVKAELRLRTTELAGLQNNDWTRRGKLEKEISKLTDYLVEVANNKNRARLASGTAQRSRTAVTNAINRAIRAMSKEHPSLASHLKASIKLGNSPVYEPSEIPDWSF